MSSKTLMIQGTASHVGKSVIAAALCRMFARSGYRVAPFKAQNMSNNSFVTPQGGEMGRAQVFQAQAAGIEPHVDMNPVLLKPEADTRAQVVILGQAVETMDVRQYHAYQHLAWQAVKAALRRLQDAYDLVVIEGAGSPAEINLRSHDIANMKVAALADAPVLLVGDIERGGVFASLVGTMALLRPSERERVLGFLINKFRGDPTLLAPGLDDLEERTKVPVLGVLPYVFNLPADEEDAVTLDRRPRKEGRGALDIGVVHMPHISNATDFEPLRRAPDVSVRYIENVANFGRPDVVILPGTKSTISDFEWMQQQGIADRILEHARGGGWTIGICGGYQMLGREIRDPEGVETRRNAVAALALLPVITVFEERKRLVQTEATCLLPGLEGVPVRGYEIHQGQTTAPEEAVPAFKLTRPSEVLDTQADGSAKGLECFGTYLHGLFDHAEFRRGYLNQLRERKGLTALPQHAYDTRPKDFDQLADWLCDAIDVPRLCARAGLPPIHT